MVADVVSLMRGLNEQDIAGGHTEALPSVSEIDLMSNREKTTSTKVHT